MLRVRGFVCCFVCIVFVVVLCGCDWSLARYDPALTGYNPTETRVGVGNVGSLTEQWRGDVHSQPSAYERSPVVASGRLYIAEEGGSLDVFSASGSGSGCSGTPRTCQPLWSYTGSSMTSGTGSDPSVVNGVVYGTWSDGLTAELDAFDAAGNTNCSGMPKVCGPVWHGAPVTDALDTPTIANGIVYVGGFDSGTLYAYDASGHTNCSGTQPVCSPLFTAVTAGKISSPPAIAAGVAYVATQGDVNNRLKLYAFDASGVTNCSGTPTTCAPLWTAEITTDGQGGQVAAPVVSQGTVFVATSDTTTTGALVAAFDAAGVANCGGNPKTCGPLWSASLDGAIFGTPAVAKGVLYTGTEFASGGGLYAFDARGVTNCSGTPNICAPLWSAPVGGIDYSSPAVANGVVYVGSLDHNLYAFDASGTINCAGTPETCTPLFTATTGGYVISSPIVANGSVYVGSNDGYVHAYSL
jgi:outer membrane protein assembly factor BamB